MVVAGDQNVGVACDSTLQKRVVVRVALDFIDRLGSSHDLDLATKNRQERLPLPFSDREPIVLHYATEFSECLVAGDDLRPRIVDGVDYRFEWRPTESECRHENVSIEDYCDRAHAIASSTSSSVTPSSSNR